MRGEIERAALLALTGPTGAATFVEAAARQASPASTTSLGRKERRREREKKKREQGERAQAEAEEEVNEEEKESRVLKE